MASLEEWGSVTFIYLSILIVLLLCFILQSTFFVSGSPAVEEAYEAVVSIVSPGQQYLTGESLHSLFNTLEHRVHCGEVPCEKVDASSGDQKQEVGAVLGYVLYHALQGHCFADQSLPDESFFVNYIMEQLGSENFTILDLKALMKSLNIGPSSEEDHGHEHTADEHADHDDNVQRWRKRSSDSRCFSAEELVQIYGLAENSSASSGLGRPGVVQLSPALVQQILSGACADITDPEKPDGLSKAERYLYATIANFLITVISMFGIVVLLCAACTSVFQMCIQFCISLAVGSLTGDALLHLMPTFLGLHVHSDNGGSSEHSSHSHEEETPDYVYKMLVLIAGIYCFYLMEVSFSLITYENKKTPHTEHIEESEPHHCDHGRVLEMYQQEQKQKDTKSQSISKEDLVRDMWSCESFHETVSLKIQRLLPYMITIGDTIHNFADGLALGAAFALSWKSGLATSLAVLCHELPHELGDFAILLNCGLSVRKALALNIASTLTSFIGMYVALSVATDLATQQWIGAITAGLFLYVGLADMLPTMIHISNKKPWLTFLLQNVGLLAGWGILLLLSLYEEKISF
uniref:Zinc transporter ZIP4/12 EF-hand domain-containing protein n=1 Tax=Astatotilapia calliptera TaxID=8154 RepID=A0A3P8PKL4_ASTCA